METLTYEDVRWCLTRLPQSLVKLLKEQEGKIFLAGGFIRACIANERVSDIDLLASTKENAELLARRTAEKQGRFIETCNAYTIVGKYKTAVQFVHRWTFDSPKEAIDSFDFTIAKAAIWFDGKNWRSVCHPNFYSDLAAKRLVYCSPQRVEEVGGSLLRVLKFYQRGYRIPLDSLGAVLARVCTGVDYCKVDPLDEQDHGMILSGLLREVDPLIDPTEAAYFPMPESFEEEVENDA